MDEIESMAVNCDFVDCAVTLKMNNGNVDEINRMNNETDVLDVWVVHCTDSNGPLQSFR